MGWLCQGDLPFSTGASRACLLRWGETHPLVERVSGGSVAALVQVGSTPLLSREQDKLVRGIAAGRQAGVGVAGAGSMTSVLDLWHQPK